MNLSLSTAHTLKLTDLAMKLADELAPAVGAHWDELYESTGDGGKNPDFGATCSRIAGILRSLQAQLLMAALAAELEPGRHSRRLVRRFQERLNHWINRLRGLLMLSRFDAEADRLASRRTYFRPIKGLDLDRGTRPLPTRIGEMLKAMMALEPRAFFEAEMGMRAMAGFPDRPSSPQQQRRKRRRRRRSNRGAPTASCRGAHDEEE